MFDYAEAERVIGMAERKIDSLVIVFGSVVLTEPQIRTVIRTS